MRQPLFAALLLLTSLSAHATCMENDQKRLWNYEGSMAQKYAIGLTLKFSGATVEGEYFYVSQRKDIALNGTLSKDKALELDERNPSGAVTAHISGKFDSDCSHFDGQWQKVGDASALPLHLDLSNSSTGELDHRYGVAGNASDNVVHANAEKFWLAVKQDDRKAVAAAVSYPLRAQLKGHQVTLRSAKEVIANYDAIFTPAFRTAVLATVPHNMSASWEGIMLGEKGEVWLNSEGKPFALNN